MSRGIGEFDFIQGAIPDSFAIVVALLTQLGDIWFVSVLLAVLFVRVDGAGRDRIVTIGGLVIGAIGLVFAAKYLFALPRPDQPLVALGALPANLRPIYELTGLGTGYGFPSGHAIVSTVTYLALAETLSVSTRRRRYTVATAVITLVCFTRVALGLHYLVDVLAGALLGVVFLFVAFRALARYRSTERQRTIALGIGVVLAAASVLASGAQYDSLLLLIVASAVFGLSHVADGSRTTPT